MSDEFQFDRTRLDQGWSLDLISSRDNQSGFPSRRIYVLLPPEECLSEQQTPTLYFQDGDACFGAGGLFHRHWKVADLLTDLVAAKRIVAPVAIGICPMDRNLEYTHLPWGPASFGGVEVYGQEVAQQILPLVNSHYGLAQIRERTIIIGASHGGLAAFHVGLSFPQLFGKIISYSPSFWAGLDDGSNFPWSIQVRPDARLENSELISRLQNGMTRAFDRPEITLGWGLCRTGGAHNEFIEAAATYRGREMATLLCERFHYELGRDLSIREDLYGGHDEETWSEWLRDDLCRIIPLNSTAKT